MRLWAGLIEDKLNAVPVLPGTKEGPLAPCPTLHTSAFLPAGPLSVYEACTQLSSQPWAVSAGVPTLQRRRQGLRELKRLA